MKNIKKYMKFLLVVLVAFAIRTANVYAATKHQFSFKAYTCDEIEELDSGGYGCTTDPVAVTNTTGSFLPGKILQLDLWYKPGDDPCTMMQVGINYDNTKLEAIMDGEYAIQAGPILSTAKGGIYPTKTATSKLTNWQFDSNVYQNRQVLFLIEDKMLEQPLTNEGTLVSVFFRVKDNAVAGESFSFTYDEGYTLLNTEAPFQTTPASYKIYQQVDSDTTITAVNVVSGSTTYPTKEAISNTRDTYTVYVPNSVSSVNVSAIPTKTTTTVTSANNQSLTVGTTKTVELTATAQSLDTKKYYINVYRLNNDNTLSNLTLSGINYGTFNKNTTTYNVTVPYTTTSTSVSATTTDTKATKTGTGNKTLNVGLNEIEVVVTPENCKSDYSSVPGNTCTTKTYKVNVTREAASTNANLSDLRVDGTQVPDFNPNTLEYTLPGVANNKSSVNVTYVKADETSTVTGDGTRTLAVGDNQLKVTVTAQDGTTKKEYKINIRRVSNDSTLKSLTISSNPSGTLNPTTFSASTTEYTYTVGPDVTAVTISAVKNHDRATLDNNGGTYNPLTTSKVEFLVVAEDNSSTKYTVNLVRNKSNNANLSSLSVTGYSISPNFNASTTSYTLIVPPTVSSINVNATLADTKATKTGDTSYNVTVGSNNTATVHVVAENTTTFKDYVITTTRLSGENRLQNLTLSGINYGTFDKDTTTYNVTVPYTTTSTSVSATTLDTKATKTGTGNKTLSVGLNEIEVEVSPENCKSEYSAVPNNTCTKKTYKVNVTRSAASTNAYLSDLKVDGVTVPGFSEDTLEYTLADVANSKSSVNITYVKADETSTVTGDGTKTLAVGDNELKVTVTAQDGTTKKEYKINIRRKSNDATLRSLTVTSNPSGTLSPTTFSASNTEYTYTVGPDVTEVTIAAVKNHERARLSTEGGTYNPQTTSKVEITVTAEDETENTYTINLARNKSNNANLSALSVTGYSISPNFNANTTAYTLIVPPTVSSINVNATLADTKATKTGDTTYNVTVGSNNTATVHVVAENGTTTKDYVITTTRLSGENRLQSLTLSGINYGTFDKDTINYSVTVPYTTTSTSVSATATDTKATLSGTGTKTLVVGLNQIEVEVSPENCKSTYSTVPNNTCTKKTYTVNVTREAASTNASLSDLKVDGVTVPNFDPDTLEYTLADVANYKSSVNITYVKADETSTVTGDGTKTLTVGDNELKVTITAQDGTTKKEYKINIRRKSNDATLKSLTVTSNPAGVLSETFNPSTLEYTYTVNSTVSEITVNGVKNHESASVVSGNGTYNLNESTFASILVRAEDGTELTYKVNFVKSLGINANLSSLSVVGYTISPEFDKDTTSYTLTVPSGIDSVEITATPEDPNGSVENDGTKALNYGENTFTINGVAENGTTKKPYSVKITRTKKNIATLSDIKVNGETIESFDPSVTEYTLSDLPNDVDSINVTATLTDSDATVDGTGDIPLGVGDNEITLLVTAQDGTENPYVIHVTREASEEDEYITSIEYGHTIEDGMIKTVAYKTKPEQLKDQLDNDNEKLEIWDKDETAIIGENTNLGTGMIVKLIINGIEKDRKIIVVKGDVDGNGEIALLDAVMVLNHYLEKTLLTGPYMEAADTNTDADIGLLDAVNILKIYLSE